MQRVSLLPSDGPLADGLRAYAYEQAALEREIFKKWALKWKGTCNRAIPVISALMGEDWVVAGGVKTRLTLTDFLLHQVRSEFRSSGVFI